MRKRERIRRLEHEVQSLTIALDAEREQRHDAEVRRARSDGMLTGYRQAIALPATDAIRANARDGRDFTP